MGHAKLPRVYRPRELRRRVLVLARLRQAGSWSDVCIGNVSSRGMMIQTSRPLAPGSEVEIWRGAQTITAKVAWRDGFRTGLKAKDLVPIEQLVPREADHAPSLQGERRSRPRNGEQSRLTGRAFEFAAAMSIATCLAAASVGMVKRAFARPLATVSAALAR